MRYLGASTVFQTLDKEKRKSQQAPITDILKNQNSQKRDPSPKSIPNSIHSTNNNSALLSTMSTNLISPSIDNSSNTIRSPRQEKRKEFQANGDIPDRKNDASEDI